jgi:protein-tyrosine phosphatase/membrane-associated phospholipid phosphatase
MSFWKAARTSAFLSVLFLIVYGTANWISSLRPDVGTLYFEWERHIPFVPWMIVPYMSIDLFFIAAPFLCHSDDELRTLRKRITFGILFGGACFLLFPLRFAFDRPAAGGWLGIVFDAFRTMDKPYNLLPSLHITLRTILAATYARQSRGLWRTLSHIWFSLIGISTLLTYQHHVLDVLGGFVLATFCFYLFPEKRVKWPVIVNRRVGIYYAIGAGAIAFIATLLWPWGFLLMWPAASLAIVAGAYFGLGPAIYRKGQGRLPLSTRCVLGPVLAGQYASLRYYQRQCRPYDVIMPGVWIGRKLNDLEAAEATKKGVTAVLDLTAEFDEARPFLQLSYLNIPILDLTAPGQDQLRTMAAFIEQHSSTGVVYVHCKIGYSRSAGAIAAYLLSSDRAASVDEALSMLRAVRPSIVVRPEIVQALREFSQIRDETVAIKPEGVAQKR